MLQGLPSHQTEETPIWGCCVERRVGGWRTSHKVIRDRNGAPRELFSCPLIDWGGFKIHRNILFRNPERNDLCILRGTSLSLPHLHEFRLTFFSLSLNSSVLFNSPSRLKWFVKLNSASLFFTHFLQVLHSQTSSMEHRLSSFEMTREDGSKTVPWSGQLHLHSIY